MDKLYLYFDGRDKPVMTFSPFIINDIYEWCRALAMSFLIDGYCFRPYDNRHYNDPTKNTEPEHMETWNKDQFTKIVNDF